SAGVRNGRRIAAYAEHVNAQRWDVRVDREDAGTAGPARCTRRDTAREHGRHAGLPLVRDRAGRNGRERALGDGSVDGPRESPEVAAAPGSAAGDREGTAADRRLRRAVRNDATGRAWARGGGITRLRHRPFFSRAAPLRAAA